MEHIYKELKLEDIEKVVKDTEREFIIHTNKAGIIDVWLKEAEEGLDEAELMQLGRRLRSELKDGLYTLSTRFNLMGEQLGELQYTGTDPITFTIMGRDFLLNNGDRINI